MDKLAKCLGRGAAWVFGIITALAGLLLIYRFVLVDTQGQPVCHKVVTLAFMNWQDVNKTQEYPNVRGDSDESLKLIVEYMGTDLTETYRYVPGLRMGDPGDLVLMYMGAPTRWTWHGQPPTIFEAKAWIVVPVDMKFYGPDRDDAGPGECSERFTRDEFKRRLHKTLDFLRANDRPNWQAVADEHTRLLDTIESEED